MTQERRLHPNRGNWEAIPYNVRLTLSEAAAIIGITRKTLQSNYTGRNPHCHLPPGFIITREVGEGSAFLIRMK